MDPISVVTTSAALVAFCAKLSKKIFTFVNNSQQVDTSVHVLDVEIESLSQVLRSISVGFSDSSLATKALEPQTGHEERHWKDFKRSMDDCKGTLEALDRILEPMRSESRLFGRPIKQIKLEKRATEISLLKQQIAAYRQTMSLSLQLITMYPS
jgi:hypothetical protein